MTEQEPEITTQEPEAPTEQEPDPEIIEFVDLGIAQQAAIRESRRQAAEDKLEVTRPGGSYRLSSGGMLVDAIGEPIDATEEEIMAEIAAIREATPTMPY